MTDTHCHLNDPESFPDPDAAIAEAKAAGVERLILIGVQLESSRRAVEIAERHEGVYAVVGIHPNYSADYEPANLDTLREMAKSPKVVAIGEIGLDYHWDYCPVEIQLESTLGQLGLAEELGLPVVYHCREAYSDLLSLLEAREQKTPYLFHCFAGTQEDAQRALSMDSFFGVDGPITYKKADELRQTIRSIPLDRLLIETDSPYLSPHPLRGKPNSPANLGLINRALAELFQMSEADMEATLDANAGLAFRLP